MGLLQAPGSHPFGSTPPIFTICSRSGPVTHPDFPFPVCSSCQCFNSASEEGLGSFSLSLRRKKDQAGWECQGIPPWPGVGKVQCEPSCTQSSREEHKARKCRGDRAEREKRYEIAQCSTLPPSIDDNKHMGTANT